MLSINKWSSAINHVAQSCEQSCKIPKRWSIDLSQSNGLQVTESDLQQSRKRTFQEYNIQVSW